MKIGAHISSAKPFSEAINRASSIGCECMQIFVNPPQRWNPSPIPAQEIDRFIILNRSASISPIIIHSIYLNNFGSDNPFFFSASIKSLIDDMNKAKAIGAMGANTHLGSTKGREFKEVIGKVVLGIKDILSATDKSTFFIIENSAGAGSIIGDTIEEIAEIIQSVSSDRVKVLIDTAHAFESGYDLRTEELTENFLLKFDKEIGLDQLVGFHLNDSKTPMSSKRDRHADIGEGFIGLESFNYLVSHPKLTEKFGILETPQDQIPWPEQIEILKKKRAK